MADKNVVNPADEMPDRSDASSPTGEAGGSPDPLADLQRERDDYHDRWLRKSAEFDNYRKRIDRERREQRDLAVSDLLLEVLNVVDDFERALTADAGEGGSYRKGIELIHAKLQDLLKKQGVTPIEAIGTDFDPNVHQAVTQESSPGHRDGEVIGELRRGYLINGRLLRPAMVKVATA